MAFLTLVHGIILLSLPWVALEVISHYWKPFRKPQRLPLTSRSSSTSTGENEGIQLSSKTSITRGSLWIKLETSALNTIATSVLLKLGVPLSRPLNVRRSDRTSRRVHRFYDVGSIFAAIALVLSLIVMLAGTLDLIGQIADYVDPSDELEMPKANKSVKSLTQIALHRRHSPVPDAPANGKSTSRWSPNLVPLIPGLTLPWNHIVPLFLALSFAQIVHEAGHAVCGALHDLEPIRIGLVLLFPAIPGAFVVLPRQASRPVFDEDDEGEGSEDCSENDETTLVEKMRTISAGVWHNALSACIIGLIFMLPIDHMLRSALWQDAGGLRVHAVDPSSPLALHIGSKALIVGLDDVAFNQSIPSTQRASQWHSFLSHQLQPSVQGWCVPLHEWDRGATVCCDKYDEHTSAGREGEAPQSDNSLCYVSPDALHGRCYDPVSLANGLASRCTTSCAQAEHICITPDSREDLLRLSVKSISPSLIGAKDGDQTSKRTVLFQGSREAVQRALQVTPYDFRLAHWLWPETMFNWCSLLFRYAFTLSVAMALFNMLPLPSLDGDVFLQIFLAFISQKLSGDAFERRRQHRLDADGAEDDLEMNVKRQKDRARMTVARSHTQKYGRTLARRSEMADTDADLSSFGPSRHIHPFRSRQVSSGQRTAKAKTMVHLHTRIRWTTMALATFVMGGSIIMHILQSD